MSLVQEFKTFAMKGNVVDLAVGVIIGAAFGKIVSSLVDNVLMPRLECFWAEWTSLISAGFLSRRPRAHRKWRWATGFSFRTA